MTEFLPLLKVGRDMDEGGFDYQISTSPITIETYKEIVFMTYLALNNLNDYVMQPGYFAAGSNVNT